LIAKEAVFKIGWILQLRLRRSEILAFEKFEKKKTN